MKKVILDLCGGTGSWSKPWKDAGYDVRVVTLPEYDVRQWWYDYRLNDLDFPIHGILAAPPCTEFSKAKGNVKRDFEGAMEVVKACMEIIWEARIKGGLKFWALENPLGFMRQFLGLPAYTFEQWQYGSLTQKPTDLWGYFNIPVPTVSVKPPEVLEKWGNGSHGVNVSDPKCPEEYKHLKLDRSAIRAITPPGFAKAFFDANNLPVRCDPVVYPVSNQYSLFDVA